jgi:hypothetical protein
VTTACRLPVKSRHPWRVASAGQHCGVPSSVQVQWSLLSGSSYERFCILCDHKLELVTVPQATEPATEHSSDRHVPSE